MRSLRIEADLEERLMLAARIRGESLSEFIRQAAADRADVVLGGATVEFDDVVGAVHGGGGRARGSGAAFTDALAEAAEPSGS